MRLETLALHEVLLLVLVGLVAGVLNVLAGGGSFLTLPVLIFLGLPPSVANGTNRVGILLQNVGAVWGFRRQGISTRRFAMWTAVPATLGSVLGSGLALWVGDQAFQKILAFLMVAVTLGSLASSRTSSSRRSSSHQDTSQEAAEPTPDGKALGLAVGFFFVGVYGGFVQAGVGFLILAVTTWAGLDLVRGNAVKVFAVLCLTALALGVFAWQGRVDWVLGLCMAVGSVLGGILGSRLAVLKGDRWLRVLVTVMVIIFAVKLWWTA